MPSVYLQKMFAHLAVLWVAFVTGALALSSPPAGAITVGSGGKYASLSAALKDTSSSVSSIGKLGRRRDLQIPDIFALGVLHFSRDIQGHRDHYESEHTGVRSDEHSEFLHWEQSVLFSPSGAVGR